jgi:carbamoyl-phosphate synthase large subunit
MKMKKILILGAGIMQVPVIRKANELNIYTIVIDYDENAPGVYYANEFHVISTNDVESVLSLAKRLNIDGILTTSDYPVNVVAKVAMELELPGMSVELAKLCTNKYFQRQFFSDHNINVPTYRLIESVNDLSLIDFFPCIIKPVDSSASRGVKMVHNREELFKQYPVSKALSKSNCVIVEEFICGREFSVETITQCKTTYIVQITEKLTTGENAGYFVEDTHITPARITPLERASIETTVYDVLRKMNVNNCPAHTELKLNEKGVFIIEVACRLGGDFITSDLVPLSTGVDMLKNLIMLSLGEKINIECLFNMPASIQFITPNNYVRCVNFINGQNPYIVRSEVFPFKKQEISNSNDRLGYIILNTPDMELMEQLLFYIK